MAADKKQILLDYVSEYAVLVVDKNPSSRNRLLKVLVDMGVKRHMIYTVGTITEAEETIDKNKIGIVLADYIVGGGSGFDLFKIVREKFPTNGKLCLILVTANTSQSTVAQAAEEDVDSFILKPYTIQSIQENLLTSILAKINPSKYITAINMGKKFLESNDYDKACQFFEKATTLNSKPSLAMFYLGEAKHLNNDEESAKEKYSDGLGIVSIHFKCLIGLYTVYMNEQKYFEAYEIVSKVASYFPANPERLGEVIRLAVVTQHFSDMEKYYEIYTAMEERDAQLTNYIGAGLYVAGKHFLTKTEVTKALALFDKIAVSCSEYSKFIKAMIYTLADYGLHKESAKFLKRFPAKMVGTTDYELCHYISTYGEYDDLAGAIQQGLFLYNKNLRDFHMLNILVKSMIKCNISHKAEPMIKEIQKLWPDKSLDESYALKRAV